MKAVPAVKPKPAASPAAHVFVVDDSPTVLQIATAVLTKRGYRVTGFESGADVCAAALEDRPILILLDFAMPGPNGYEVLGSLGVHHELEAIPVILMITRGDVVGDRLVRELGICDYITKPFSPSVLAAVVDHVVGKQQAQRASAAESVTDVHTSTAVQQSGARLAERIAQPLFIRDEPSLSGDLAQVPVAEVMQLLALQRQTGVLTIRRHEAAVALAFANGVVCLVTGQNMGPHLLLGAMLIQERLLTAAQLEAALAQDREIPHRLGRHIVEQGHIVQADLMRVLHRQSAELVYEMLRFKSGSFTFVRVTMLPEEAKEFGFSLRVDELLLEGYRRVDEWGLIERVLPSFDLIPISVPGAVERVGPDSFDPFERAILEVIDGRCNVNDIIAHVARPPFDVARALYGLVAAHMLAVTTPREIVIP